MSDTSPAPASPSRSGRAFRWILGGLAGVFGLFVLAALMDKPKRPAPVPTERGDVKFVHSMIVPVRRANESDFTDETTRVRIEAFRDEANGNIVYLSRPQVTRKGSSVSAVSGGSR